ncbi:chaperonin HslO [Luminiphilus syltensis NOR5-1B]|uniref:Chaperonin HslO n=1 Tax=Luminiphilus syltensis NOR5-1B TaxID=565045 RepID=B8KSS2_9GAMM|nr:Hsp33 family molecular chaperone HslO [Luminiphilus syltensis]EED34410.1 chaperonin HslO [Luminiphilus syltensis NOR5-1B]
MRSDSDHDISARFLFDEADIRGESVRLQEALAEMLSTHPYSAASKRILGEFACAAVLISNNLKYRGRIVLQARSDGPLSMVMVECTSDREIRGIARGDISADPEDHLALLSEGQLAITIEREGGQRYQGIVALDRGSLAATLEDYFLQSEQLNTRFWLASNGVTGGGLMLQQLPAQLEQGSEQRGEQWANVCILADTLTTQELNGESPQTLIYRLFHEETLRLFEPKSVVFHCSCSRERSLNALSALPEGELAEIIADEGIVSMNCEMCGVTYEFAQSDIPGLAKPKVLH